MKLSRVLSVAVLATALSLVLAPGAGAAITSTNVESPGDPTFGIHAETALEYTVTGTTVGGSVGEELELRCYFTTSLWHRLATGVTVEAGGTFTATGVEPETDSACRLRAIPTGTEPSNLAAFTGPVVAVGESNVFHNPNTSQPTDFYLNAQGVTAADDYQSTSSCGLTDGYLNTDEFESIFTFFCNDFFDYGPTTNSGFLVEGENAYTSAAATEINGLATGAPSLEYTYSQDPLTGDVTVHDGEAAAFCPTAEFPPMSCGSFHPSGVRVDRTIEGTHDGHVVVITDEFSSTDGDAHPVETLPGNYQSFNEHGDEVEFAFPGTSGYALPSLGQSVDFADSEPGAVYLKVAGAPDGDPETGRGAIVFFQPSSPATFTQISARSNAFHFVNEFTVPATGSTTVKYAYVQAVGQAEVEALTDELLGIEPPPTGTTTPPSTGSPAPPPPVLPIASTSAPAKVTLGKVVLDKRKGTARLQVKVSGPGTVKLTGKNVRPETLRAKKAGALYLPVVPTAATRKVLRERGAASVAVTVTFKAAVGGSKSGVKKIRLRLQS